MEIPERRIEAMAAEQSTIRVSSFTGEEVDVEAFIADARKLASERGLAESDIEFEAEDTFPIEGAILIGLTLASKIAYDIWKEFIVRKLKEKYRIKEV
jgi:hypothetical protein